MRLKLDLFNSLLGLDWRVIPITNRRGQFWFFANAVLVVLMVGFTGVYGGWELVGFGLIFATQVWILTWGFQNRLAVWLLTSGCEPPCWRGLFHVGIIGHLGIVVFHGLGWLRGFSDYVGPVTVSFILGFLVKERRLWLKAVEGQRRLEKKMIRWARGISKQMFTGDSAWMNEDAVVLVKPWSGEENAEVRDEKEKAGSVSGVHAEPLRGEGLQLETVDENGSGRVEREEGIEGKQEALRFFDKEEQNAERKRLRGDGEEERLLDEEREERDDGENLGEKEGKIGDADHLFALYQGWRFSRLSGPLQGFRKKVGRSERTKVANDAVKKERVKVFSGEVR